MKHPLLPANRVDRHGAEVVSLDEVLAAPRNRIRYDALLSEARATARQITTALPDDEMRRRFQASQPVRNLGRF